MTGRVANMSNTFVTIAIVALILGILLLAAAAVIFVKLKIWLVWADLSGKTAQASIELMRVQEGKAAPRKRHHSYVVNSGMLKKNTENLEQGKTEPISRRFGRKTESLKNGSGTLPLGGSGGKSANDTMRLNKETSLLNNDDGTVLLNREEGTVMLNSGATTVINQTGKPLVRFDIITDIVLINTDEKIPLD